MLARDADPSRPVAPTVAPVRRAAFAFLTHAAAGDITRRRSPRRPSDGSGGIDPAEAGRASSAADAVFSRYQGLIDAISKDPSLTPTQRAAAISGLRQRQTAEAAAVSQRIMDAAKSAARMRRQMQQGR